MKNTYIKNTPEIAGKRLIDAFKAVWVDTKSFSANLIDIHYGCDKVGDFEWTNYSQLPENATIITIEELEAMGKITPNSSMEKPKSCNNSCSPSDFYKGGKCDLNGCFSADEKNTCVEEAANEWASLNGVIKKSDKYDLRGYGRRAFTSGASWMKQSLTQTNDELLKRNAADKKELLEALEEVIKHSEAYPDNQKRYDAKIKALKVIAKHKK